MFEEYPDVLTTEQVCAILGISRNTLYGYIKRGEIKAFRIGSIYRIPKKYLVDFCEKSLTG